MRSTSRYGLDCLADLLRKCLDAFVKIAQQTDNIMIGRRRGYRNMLRYGGRATTLETSLNYAFAKLKSIKHIFKVQMLSLHQYLNGLMMISHIIILDL